MRGTTAALLAATLVAIAGALHAFYPDFVWQFYRRHELYPEDSTRFTVRLVGATLLAVACLVFTAVSLLF